MSDKKGKEEIRVRNLTQLVGKKIVDAYVFNEADYDFYGLLHQKFSPYMGSDNVKIILDDGTVIHTFDGENYVSSTAMWINNVSADELGDKVEKSKAGDYKE